MKIKTHNKALKNVHFVHWDVQSVARFERPLAMRWDEIKYGK